MVYAPTVVQREIHPNLEGSSFILEDGKVRLSKNVNK
jgi:hypothetical protein